jgi:hypothetical protein
MYISDETIERGSNIFFAVLFFIPMIFLFTPYWYYLDYKNTVIRCKSSNKEVKNGWKRWYAFLKGNRGY